MNIEEIIKETRERYISLVSGIVPEEYGNGYLEALQHVQEKIDDKKVNETNIIDLTIFGSELKTKNQHWLQSYAKFFTFLCDFDMTKVKRIIRYKFPSNPHADLDTECISDINLLFISGGLDIDGYTLREIAKIFLAYSHQWWEDNLVLQRQLKIKQIEKLKKELEELESSLE